MAMTLDAPPLISFRVYGLPKAQPRARAFARRMGNTFVARVYDAGTAEGWKSEIAIAAREHIPAAPLEGPLRLDAIFLFPRPGRLLKRKSPPGRIWHTAKPDRDNLEKAALDCLTTLGAFGDDCQVCAGEVRKYYVAVGEQPGALIHLYAAEGGAA